MTLKELGECGLIERLRRRLGPPPARVLVGIGDDAAAVAGSGATLLLTTDTLLEGVHFRTTTATSRQIGAKAMAANLSDIAAMGGEPRWVLVALAVPAGLEVADVDELYAGMEEMAARHGAALIGGDTSASPDRIVLALTVVGEVEGTPLTRRGARPGDAILVTGELGAAAAGLALLEGDGAGLAPQERAPLEQAHRAPTPRVREGRLIRQSGVATAMIDLSDGLAGDLGHIAAESGVGARVRLGALPVGAATRRAAAALGQDPWRLAVTGGEDYELLFTAPAAEADGLAARVARETGTPVSRIGEIRPAADGVAFVGDDGRAVPVGAGFDHFAARGEPS